jgi:RNA polymerase sigma-70 factor (ECF subfamily)
MTLPHWCAEPPSHDSPDPERYRGRLRAISDAGREDSLDPAERRVVEGIRAGDERVFETVYRSVYASLWRFAVRLVQSRDGANDVVQDVFLSIWAHRETLSVRTTIRAYLYGAVRQRALRYVRHQRVVDRSATDRAAEIVGTLAGGQTETATADVRTESDELVQLVRAAIHTLPERQRLAMLLYLDDELTPPEIAAALGVTPVAVRKLLAKATSRVRDALPDF